MITTAPQRRERFLAALRAATHPRSRLRVVITLRADLLDRPLAYPDFAEVLRSGTELILPLNAEELERAHETAKNGPTTGALDPNFRRRLAEAALVGTSVVMTWSSPPTAGQKQRLAACFEN